MKHVIFPIRYNQMFPSVYLNFLKEVDNGTVSSDNCVFNEFYDLSLIFQKLDIPKGTFDCTVGKLHVFP